MSDADAEKEAQAEGYSDDDEWVTCVSDAERRLVARARSQLAPAKRRCDVCGDRPAAYCARCSVSDDQIAAHKLTQARLDAVLAVVAELREVAVSHTLAEAVDRIERAARGESK